MPADPCNPARTAKVIADRLMAAAKNKAAKLYKLEHPPTPAPTPPSPLAIVAEKAAQQAAAEAGVSLGAPPWPSQAKA